MRPQFNIRTLLAWTTISAVILVVAKFVFADPLFFWLLAIYGFCLGVYMVFIVGHKFRINTRQAEIVAKREKILLDEQDKIDTVKKLR